MEDDTFELTVEAYSQDNAKGTLVASLMLQITTDPDGSGGNTQPYAVDDSATTDETVAVNIHVLDNDGDADGDALSVSRINGTSVSAGDSVDVGDATVVLETDGTLTVTPDANFDGDIVFSYDAFDGTLSDTASVTVHVNDTIPSPPPPPPPPPPTGGVQVWLVDPETDLDIREITNLDTITLEGLSSGKYALRAEYTGTETVESFRFYIDGEHVRTESGAPYAVYGDSNGDFRGETMEDDTFELTVEAYSQDSAKGTLVSTLTLQITTDPEGDGLGAAATNAMFSMMIEEEPFAFDLQDTTGPDSNSLAARAGATFEAPDVSGDWTSGFIDQASHNFRSDASVAFPQEDAFDFAVLSAEPTSSDWMHELSLLTSDSQALLQPDESLSEMDPVHEIVVWGGETLERLDTPDEWGAA